MIARSYDMVEAGREGEVSEGGLNRVLTTQRFSLSCSPPRFCLVVGGVSVALAMMTILCDYRSRRLLAALNRSATMPAAATREQESRAQKARRPQQRKDSRQQISFEAKH